MKICTSCSEPYTDDAAFCPNDGAELKRSADPYLGRTLAARYRLIKRLGAGGMSVVYLARHVMIERMSAIKILRQDLGMSPTHRERFLREARAVKIAGRDRGCLEERLLAGQLKARQLGGGARLAAPCLDRGDLLGAGPLLQVLQLGLRRLKLLRGLAQRGALGRVLELEEGCTLGHTGALGYKQLIKAPCQR